MHSLAPSCGERVGLRDSMPTYRTRGSPPHPDRCAIRPLPASGGEVSPCLQPHPLSNVHRHDPAQPPRTSFAAPPPPSMPASARRRASCAKEGLSRAPGEPMLNHLLAAVLFSNGEIEPPVRHVEASLAKRPGQCRRASARGAHRARRRGFRRGAVASRSGDRDRAATRSISRESPNARSGRLFAKLGQAREAWRAILEVIPQNAGGRGAARAAGMGRWRPRRRGVACSSAP